MLRQMPANAGTPAAHTPAMPPAPRPLAHRPYEDVQGLLAGTLFVALGALMFAQAKLLTGGTAGIALLVTIVSINLVGDQLRDVLNPRLKK